MLAAVWCLVYVAVCCLMLVAAGYLGSDVRLLLLQCVACRCRRFVCVCCLLLVFAVWCALWVFVVVG